MVGCDNTFKCCSTASEAELWTCFESRASVISRPYPDSMIESSSFSVCLFNRLFRSLTKDFLLLFLHRYAMALYNQHVCPVNNWYSTHTHTNTHIGFILKTIVLVSSLMLLQSTKETQAASPHQECSQRDEETFSKLFPVQ